MENLHLQGLKKSNEILLREAQKGNIASRNELFCSILPFIIKKCKNNDLIQEASLQILPKLIKWNPTRGKLTTFIGRLIVNATREYNASKCIIKIPVGSFSYLNSKTQQHKPFLKDIKSHLERQVFNLPEIDNIISNHRIAG